MKPINGLVSILLPVTNAQEFLSTCLDSLLAQTYTDFEIIAIDDFSKDKSYSLLKQYRKIDKRLRVFRNVKKYGPTITLNRAITRARGQYIAFMEARDMCTPDRLKRQISHLKQHPKTVAIGTQCLFIDENQRKVGKSSFPLSHEGIYNTLINGITMQFETAVINRHRLPKDLLKFTHTGNPLFFADLFIKLQQYGSFANLNQCLYKRLSTSKSNFILMSKQFLSHTGLFAKAIFEHGYRPALNTFFNPLIKQA